LTGLAGGWWNRHAKENGRWEEGGAQKGKMLSASDGHCM